MKQRYTVCAVMSVLLILHLSAEVIHAQVTQLTVETVAELYIDELGSTETIEWSPDGQFLAVGGIGGILILNEDLEIVQHYLPDFGRVPTLNWSPDGSRIAAVYGEIDETKIAIINVIIGDNLIIEQPYIITPIEWSPSGTRLAVGIWDNAIIIFDAVSREQTAIFQHGRDDPTNTNYPITVCWDGEDEIIAIFGRYIYRIDTFNGTLIEDILGGSGFSAECLIEKQQIFTSSGHMRYLYINTWFEFAPDFLAVDISLHPMGDYIAYNINSGFIQIWSAGEPHLLAQTYGAMGEYDGSVIFYDDSIHWHPDGELLAAVGEDNIVRIWRIEESP